MLDLEAVDRNIDIIEFAKIHKKAVNKAQFSKRHSQAEIFWSTFAEFLEERIQSASEYQGASRNQEGEENACL
jgi:hypothetical protein